MLIVKISRSKNLFWAARKNILDLLDEVDYFLVLLKSNQEVWSFSKNEVMANIESGLWRLQAGGDYKINYRDNWSLPSQFRRNRFISPQLFLVRVREYDR